MSEGPKVLLSIGFGIACIGFAALNYMNFSLQKHYRHGVWPRVTLKEYWRLVKERWVWRWPLYLAAICIPVGIVMTFGAIIYNNHMKVR
jgi:hypothetical protein